MRERVEFAFTLRNAGTAACRRVRLAGGAAARASQTTQPFTLQPSRSASEEITATAPRGAVGSTVTLSFRVLADGDVEASNDRVTMQPTRVGVGDSSARRPSGRVRRFSGAAKGGSAGKAKIAARRLRVTRVHVAVRRLGGKGCRWVASARTLRLRTIPARKAGCDRPVWLRARGTTRWRLGLRKALPSGRYVLMSRATIAAGFPEARFSARDGNRVVFRAG